MLIYVFVFYVITDEDSKENNMTTVGLNIDHILDLDDTPIDPIDDINDSAPTTPKQPTKPADSDYSLPKHQKKKI